MTLGIPYSNARIAAGELREEVAASGRAPVVARPWNMYEADATSWWLVPSKEWPAYKHGKFCFEPPPRAVAGHLFFGLHVEKGLGKGDNDVSKYPPDMRSLFIQSDWVWFRFVADMASGGVGSVLSKVASSIGGSVTLRLEAGPGVKPLSGDPSRDVLIFESTDGSSLQSKSSDTPLGHIAVLQGSQSLAQLAASIQSLPRADEFWLDIFLGAMFTLGSSPSQRDTWSASQLCTKALLPWVSWFE